MTWEPIRRVGELCVKQAESTPGIVNVEFRTFPTGQPDEWLEYFEAKAVELDMHVSYHGWGMAGDSGYVRAPAETFEEHVAKLDEALDFANKTYERQDLPKREELEQQRRQERETQRNQQADLDARAEKLKRPPAPDTW